MDEDNLRRTVHRHRTGPSRAGEVTRTDSVSSTTSSLLTVQSDEAEKPGKITKWTDEKHDSYLNFLEETFVKELNRSMQNCQWHSEKLGWGPYPAPHILKNVSDPFNQFTIVQDGRCKKIKFERGEQLVNSTGHYIPIESPWIHHFTSLGKHYSMTCDAKEHGVSSSESTQSQLQEVSDQNFLEEDLIANSKDVRPAKRSKKAAGDTCIDQVVPSGDCHTANVPTS